MNNSKYWKVVWEADEHDVPVPRPWKNAWSAPWLFTYALVILQLLALLTTRGFGLNPLYLAVNLSLAAVVPIWCVVIRRWGFVFLGTAVVAANAVLLAIVAPVGGPTLFLMPIFIGAAVAIPLVTISCYWGRFGKPGDEVGDVQQFQVGLKFGIRHLFIASAVVAVICGIGKALFPYLPLVIGALGHLSAIIMIVISFNTLVSTWALMGPSHGSGMGIFPLLAALASAGGSWFFRHGEGPWIFLMFGLCWAATTVHLALLRRSGLRFIKKRPNPELARSL